MSPLYLPCISLDLQCISIASPYLPCISLVAISPLYLPCISLASPFQDDEYSPLYLPCIAISPLYLPCISLASPFQDDEYSPFVDDSIYAARPDLLREIGYFKEPRNGRKIEADTLLQFVEFACSEELPAGHLLARMAFDDGTIEARHRPTCTATLLGLPLHRHRVRAHQSVVNDQSIDGRSSTAPPSTTC